MRRTLGLTIVLALAIAACSSDNAGTEPSTTTSTTAKSAPLLIHDGRIQACNGYLVRHEVPPAGQMYPSWWIAVRGPNVFDVDEEGWEAGPAAATLFTAADDETTFHCDEYPRTEGEPIRTADLNVDRVSVVRVGTIEDTGQPRLEVTMEGFSESDDGVSATDIRWTVIPAVEG